MDKYLNKVSLQDCLVGLKDLPDQCADIVICHPPYNIGKDFGNMSDKQGHEEWIEQCFRIFKPRGTFYIYGFRETLSFIRVRIKYPVRWLVWHYTNKKYPSLEFLAAVT